MVALGERRVFVDLSSTIEVTEADVFPQCCCLRSLSILLPGKADKILCGRYAFAKRGLSNLGKRTLRSHNLYCAIE